MISRFASAADRNRYKTGDFRFRLLNTERHNHAEVERHAEYRKRYSVSDYIERALSIASFEDFFHFASKLKYNCGFTMSGGGMSQKTVDVAPAAENTVLTHMKSVHAKLGVKTRQHAVAKALSLNLI
ncbi:MAG TPA: hypothetical protein VF268_09210 [Gammaproteobacteria bacterium]|jgi:hypothetical protein